MTGATRQRQSASGDKDGDGRIGDKSSHSVGEVRDHPDLDGARQEPKRRELTEKLRQDVSQSRRAAAAIGGIDALVFTGGIGEHAAPLRDAIVERLRFLGAFEVIVIKANEERVMALQARTCLAAEEQRQ